MKASIELIFTSARCAVTGAIYFNFFRRGLMVGKSNKPEEIASRLNKALARADAAAFIAALMEMARARGLASMARQTVYFNNGAVGGLGTPNGTLLPGATYKGW